MLRKLGKSAARIAISATLAMMTATWLDAATAWAQEASAEENAAHTLSRHVAALQNQGRPPLDFVIERLGEFDLVVFDDGLHSAADPFDFYNALVSSPEFQRLAPYVFLEVIPSNRQAALDAYFSTSPEDPRLLYPAFQENFGWPYQSYFDLLHRIYEVNQTLPEDRRIRVVAVSTPTMWREITAAADWDYNIETTPLFRDYFMYAMIREELDGFNSGRKGVFLTNTRHAYARLKSSNGDLIRSTAAFFNLWHPGRAYSVRFNMPALYVTARRNVEGEARTAAGMEAMEFRWARTAGGLWDEAFQASGSQPIAIPLAATAFGDAPYIGNLMLGTAPGQTMRNAYDAVIFLREFHDLRRTAITDAIYTPTFRREMERRYRVSHSPPQLTELLRENGVTTLRGLVRSQTLAQPSGPLGEAAAVGPIDEWRTIAADDR